MDETNRVRKLAVRCRPLSAGEHKLAARSIVHVNENLMTVELPEASKESALAYEYLYGPGLGTETVFNDIVQPMFHPSLEVLDDMVIFAYGPSQSGKSHTITGSKQDWGLVQMFCDGFLRQAAAHTQTHRTFEWGVEFHFIEIFDEDAFDLLTYTGNPLRLRESKKEGWVYFEETAPLPVKKVGDLERYLDSGFKRVRGTGAHSHLVYEFVITCFSDTEEEWKRSIIFVDLADSERAQGAAKAQKGLHVLNDTLAAIGDEEARERREHVQSQHRSFGWRDSKLTRYLHPFLDGHVCMIGCISPSASQFDETARTSQYMDKLKRFFRDYTDPPSEYASPLRRGVTREGSATSAKAYSSHAHSHTDTRTKRSTPSRVAKTASSTSTPGKLFNKKSPSYAQPTSSSTASRTKKVNATSLNATSLQSNDEMRRFMDDVYAELHSQRELISHLQHRVADLEGELSRGSRNERAATPPSRASPVTAHGTSSSGPTAYSLGPSQRFSTSNLVSRGESAQEVGFAQDPSPPRQAASKRPGGDGPKALGYSKSATAPSFKDPHHHTSLQRAPTQPLHNSRVVRQLSAPNAPPHFGGAPPQPFGHRIPPPHHMSPFLPGPPPAGFGPHPMSPQSPYGRR